MERRIVVLLHWVATHGRINRDVYFKSSQFNLGFLSKKVYNMCFCNGQGIPISPAFPGLTTWSCIGVVARGTVFRSNGAVWEESFTYAYRALSKPTMDTWRPRKMQRNKYQLLFNKVTSILFPIPETIKPRANGRNIVDQQLPTSLDVTSFVRLHTLLHVVGCCCVLLRKVWNRSNFSANNSQHFFCSVIAEA